MLALAVFYLGWYSSSTINRVSQLKMDLNTANEVIKNKDKLIVLNQQNLKNRDDENLVLKNVREQILNDLNTQRKINAENQDYINKHNVITADLLLRVGALKTQNTKLSKNAISTIRVSSTYTTVSAYDYVQWQVGKNKHDDQCMIMLNGIQKFYNEQMNLINGFSND